MPSRRELVAYQRDTPSIARAIGADLVIFQTLPDLVSSVRRFNPSIAAFDCSVFTGKYVTGGVDDAYLAHLERGRGQPVDEGRREHAAQTESSDETPSPVSNGSTKGAGDTVGLYNNWRGDAGS